MSKVAVVTGAGSGVGKATVVKLAQAGWRVVATARTPGSLSDTVTAANSPMVETIALTVGDREQTESLRAHISKTYGRLDLLVNAAGTNVPQRALEVLKHEDYQLMLDSNLNGVFYLVQAFLPMMRAQKSGTIVNIISDAAKAASPKAGPGYVVSKFGALGLTQAINAEERGHGIRACAILPGDIDTPLLDKRPSPPPAEARARMLQAEDIADCVLLAVNLPDRAVIEELLIRPRG